MFRQTSPENEAIVERLEQALATLPLGGTVTTPQLVKAAPGFSWSRNYWLLQKARERAEKNLGCIFETVRGIGVKRLSAQEIPDVGLSSLRKIRRAANRGKKRLSRVNSNSLSQGEQRRVVGMVAMLGAVAMIADGRKANAIATVADPVRPVPPKNILEMFRTE
jgi:hypothetical protein